MADYQLRARIQHELADEVKEIVEWLNDLVPEAEATMSTVCRFALKEYVRKNKLVREEDGALLELPLEGLNSQELAVIYQAVTNIGEVISNRSIKDAKEKLKNKLQTTEMFELIEKRKAERK